MRHLRRQQLSVAALLAASVSAAAAGCAVHQECGSCLDATDDDNDSCFCAPHRSPRTHWLWPHEAASPSSLPHRCYSTPRRVLLDPFVPGGQPFDNRAPRGEDLQRLCGLRPRQGDLRVPAHISLIFDLKSATPLRPLALQWW